MLVGRYTAVAMEQTCPAHSKIVQELAASGDYIDQCRVRSGCTQGEGNVVVFSPKAIGSRVFLEKLRPLVNPTWERSP
jgi:hypothetical protein